MPYDLGGADGAGGGSGGSGGGSWWDIVWDVIQPIIQPILPIIQPIIDIVVPIIDAWTGHGGGSQGGGGGGSPAGGTQGSQGGAAQPPPPPPPPEFEGDTPEIPRAGQGNTRDTTFNAREFYGDDFDLTVLGDGITAAFVTFLDFVIPGNWDREQQATAYQQVRTLFNLATGAFTQQQTEAQVTASNPPLSTAVIPWAREYLDLNTSNVREIESEIRDDLLNRIEQLDLNRENVDLSALSTEELVQWYSQHLRRPYGNLPSGAARLMAGDHPLDRDYVENELNRLNSLLDAMNSVLPYQSVDAFISVTEWGLSSEADARSFLIRNLGQLNDYNLDPDWYEMDTLELIRLWRYELDEFVLADQNVAADYNYGAFWTSEGQDIDYLAQIQNLQILENTYVPPTPPDLTLLGIVASMIFEPVDWVMGSIDVLHDLAEGDFAGAAANIVLMAMPLVPYYTDEVAAAVIRPASEGGGVARLLPSGAADDVVPRRISGEELGIQGASEFNATFTLEGGVATVRVDMIVGDIQNPFEVYANAVEFARS